MNKNLIMKPVIILSTLFFLFQSCDGPYANCDEYYFNDELKSYVLFQDGSSWVYADDSLSIIDTITILDYEIDLIDYCDYSTSFEEVLTQFFSSSYFSQDYVFCETRAGYGYFNNSGDNYFLRKLRIETSEIIDTMIVNDKAVINNLENTPLLDMYASQCCSPKW